MIELIIDITRSEIIAGQLSLIRTQLDLLRWKPKKKKKPRKKERPKTFKEILLERGIRREADERERDRHDDPLAPSTRGWESIFEDQDGDSPQPFYTPSEADGI